MHLRSAAVAILVIFSTSACGASRTNTPSISPSASAVDQWNKAYAFLATQTKPTEIVCAWFRSTGGAPSPVNRIAEFYGFSDTGSWKSHIVTRTDTIPTGTFEDCQATVPTSVPYGPHIETFLQQYGLVFATTAPGLTPIEIAYAGQNASDPDIIYRDKPGLFGLRMALQQLGTKPFVSGTSRIIQPTDATIADQYLKYAKPLLDWYGYRG